MIQAIEIFQENNNSNKKKRYRAIQGNYQAQGSTAGKALDMLESQKSKSNKDQSGTVVIVQRFKSDKFFNASQQIALQDAMDKFRQSLQSDHELTNEDKEELEMLIEMEWMAAIGRAASIIGNSENTSLKTDTE